MGMKDWTGIKSRYLRDTFETRLGGLAANLARIASFSNNDGHRSAVRDLIVESEHFIEWTAFDAGLDGQEKLVMLQRQLARWQIQVERGWDDKPARQEMADAVKKSSKEILEMSGLLTAS
jgi:hypothetical protein